MRGLRQRKDWQKRRYMEEQLQSGAKLLERTLLCVKLEQLWSGVLSLSVTIL